MAKWHYYDDDGNRITVTGKELKELAKDGLITPDTIVENEEGKSAPAGKVKGLVFAEILSIGEGEDIVPPITEETHELASPPIEPILPPSVLVPPIETISFPVPVPADLKPFTGKNINSVIRKTLWEMTVVAMLIAVKKIRALVEKVKGHPQTPESILSAEASPFMPNGGTLLPTSKCLKNVVVDWHRVGNDWYWFGIIVPYVALLGLFGGGWWYIASLTACLSIGLFVLIYLLLVLDYKEIDYKVDDLKPGFRLIALLLIIPFMAWGLLHLSGYGLLSMVIFATVYAAILAGLFWASDKVEPLLLQVEKRIDKMLDKAEEEISGDFSETVKSAEPFTQVEVLSRLDLEGYQTHHNDIFNAAKKGTVRDVAYFIKNGVSCNAQSQKGLDQAMGYHTPLHIAVDREWDGSAIMKFLLEVGADVNIKDDDGKTPLDMYAANSLGHGIIWAIGVIVVFCVLWFSKWIGVILAIVGIVVEIPWIIDKLKKRSILRNAGAKRGKDIPLTAEEQERAEQRAEQAEIDNWFAMFADLNKCSVEELKNEKNVTLLHCAAALGKIELVKSLVFAGDNVNEVDFARCTPLHYAISNISKKRLEIAKFLISNGASVNEENDKGCTPLDFAKEMNDMAMIQYLISVDAKCGTRATQQGQPTSTPPVNSDAFNVAMEKTTPDEANTFTAEE